MEEDEKSLEADEEKGANVIEENPLFEEQDDDEEENVGGDAEKLDSSSSTLEDLGGTSTSRYKLKRSRQVARVMQRLLLRRARKITRWMRKRRSRWR